MFINDCKWNRVSQHNKNKPFMVVSDHIRLVFGFGSIKLYDMILCTRYSVSLYTGRMRESFNLLTPPASFDTG